MWTELSFRHQSCPQGTYRQFCYSVAQSCLTLCDPMECSTPGFPVLHHLTEFAQTHVHWISNVIQPSCLLSTTSPPAIFPSIRIFSNESALHIRWPKYWSFNFSISSFQLPMISFRMDWFHLRAVQRILKSLLQHHTSKVSILLAGAQPSLWSNSHICTWLLKKNT